MGQKRNIAAITEDSGEDRDSNPGDPGRENYNPPADNSTYKEDDDDYPWSVCVDDLEIFILLLWKLFEKISAYRFIEFLKYRRKYHGHLICFDEIEMCGLYLCERELFKKLSTNDSNIATDGAMGAIFDAHYAVGLGFQDEINIEIKKSNQLNDFPKHFRFDTIDLSKV